MWQWNIWISVCGRFCTSECIPRPSLASVQRLITDGRVMLAGALKLVLLCVLGTGLLRMKDVRRLSVFNHSCLHSIPEMRKGNLLSNSGFRSMVQSLKWLMGLLKWSNHALYILIDCLSCTLFGGTDWSTWSRWKGMETLADWVARVGSD